MIESCIQNFLILNSTNHLREQDLDGTLVSRDSLATHENFIPDAF